MLCKIIYSIVFEILLKTSKWKNSKNFEMNKKNELIHDYNLVKSLKCMNLLFNRKISKSTKKKWTDSWLQFNKIINMYELFAQSRKEFFIINLIKNFLCQKPNIHVCHHTDMKNFTKCSKLILSYRYEKFKWYRIIFAILARFKSKWKKNKYKNCVLKILNAVCIFFFSIFILNCIVRTTFFDSLLYFMWKMIRSCCSV